MKKLALLLFILQIQALISQVNYNSKIKIDSKSLVCKSCLQTWETLPKEVYCAFELDKNNDIIFYCTDEKYLTKLFPTPVNTITTEIVTPDLFSCKANVQPVDGKLNGFVLKPLSLLELKQNKLESPKGTFMAKFAVLPAHIKSLGKPEFNLLAVNNGILCYYQKNVAIESNNWELLDMGMYMNTPTFITKDATTNSIFDYKTQKISITIPFEKNDATIIPEVIDNELNKLKPYKNFSIQNIEVRAYSSIEGKKENNIKLQNSRARNIVNHIRNRYGKEIPYKITSDENWNEFYNEISKHKDYGFFAKASKSDIKLRLSDENLQKELEQILMHERKSIIILDVLPNYSTHVSDDELLSAYKNAIHEQKIDEALNIQQYILEKIRNQNISPDLLKTIDIPTTTNTSDLKRNTGVFAYFAKVSDLYTTKKLFEELEKLNPLDYKLKYNLAVLEILEWSTKIETYNSSALRERINALYNNSDISKDLISRIEINYHILQSEKWMRLKNYTEKNASIEKIFSYYKNLTDPDQLVYLAKFYSNFNLFNKAEEVVSNNISALDIPENLLFYYLELTLHKDYLSKNNQYEQLIDQAILLNKDRFCTFFKSNSTEGVSFQLLQNAKLKKIYCSYCEVVN